MARDQSIENTAVAREFLLSPRFAPENIEARLAEVESSPVRELNDWVENLRQDPRLPPGAGATIPWFDPRGGGADAQVLFLMQDPSQVATFTRFISPDNNDPSARNATIACERAGLAAADRVHWNIFPWWVNITKSGKSVDDTRPSQTYAAARPLARTLLADLFGMLPRLAVIVLLGNQAQAGYKDLHVEPRVDGQPVTVLCCPSTSPQAWNNIDKKDPAGRYRSDITIATLTEAAELIKP